MVLMAGYPTLFFRIYRRMRRRYVDSKDAVLYAASRVLGKFPQVLGQIRFHFEKVRLAVPSQPSDQIGAHGTQESKTMNHPLTRRISGRGMGGRR